MVLSPSDGLRNDRPQDSDDSRSRIFSTDLMTNSFETIINSIEHAINSLYKIPIRKAMPIERIEQEELVLWPESKFYEYFDILYVSDLYPTASPALHDRLGKLITRRRQALRFRRRRNERLQQASSASGWEATHPVDPSLGSKQSHNAPAVVQMFVSPETTTYNPSIKATTLQPSHRPLQLQNLILDDAISEATSELSAATSHAAQDLLEFPIRPQLANGEPSSHFECPFCCTLVRINSEDKWRSVQVASLVLITK